MSVKSEMIGHQLMEEISAIINQEMKDDRIGFVTITGAKVSSDLSYAKIYCTVLQEDKRDITLKVLNKANGFIRSELCKRIELRHMPEISFVFDESISYGQKIEKIIDGLNEKE